MKSGRIPVLAISLMLFVSGCIDKNSPDFSVVINELMASNTITRSDQNGEFDDWIELHSKAGVELDLSGYYLSDSKSKPEKWRIPDGTKIPAKGFLVIWADGDTLQSGLHSNFKLSAAGEKIYLNNPERLIIDRIEYPPQTQELSYSRKPDWDGDFVWQTPTFNSSNNINYK